MLNIIAIGLTATLDLQTRALTRVRDGASENLPASACLCLQALVEAQGEVLSHEQLMDIGWRSLGLEVTENSVRVMINKLRRAINSLALQDVITLLAVTRSGYRLVIRDGSVAMGTPPNAPSPTLTAPPLTSSASRQPASISSVKTTSWKKPIVVAACGIVAGLAVGITLYSLFIMSPKQVDFVPWNGPGVPANTQVRVQKDRQEEQSLIEATLQAYNEYVIEKYPTDKPGKVLYVTLGSTRAKNHLGIIACQSPFQTARNDCESFYFRVD